MGKVIVIGGGAAGAWSALAAHRAGADVVLVREAAGASAVSSGCFDFASETGPRGEPLPLIDAARSLARRRPSHPFARIGGLLPETIRAAVDFVCAEHVTLGVRGTDDGRSLLLVTPFGGLKETALAQGTIAGGDLRAWPKGDRIAVVPAPNRLDFDARVAASGLARHGFDAIVLPGVPVDDPRASLATLASRLDDAAHRESFADGVAHAARESGARLILLPTAGLTAPNETIRALAAKGINAAEILSVPPSIAGLRLDADLERRLSQTGIERILARVVRSIRRSGVIESVVLDDGRELSAGSVVLATGRFIGGGIRHDASGFHETVFDLPVLVDGRNVGERWIGDLLSRSATDDQPALRAGLMVDASMCPVDVAGRPMLANLFAAGGVIGGFDPAKDRSGLGAVAVTAVIAAKHAAQLACQPIGASSPGMEGAP